MNLLPRPRDLRELGGAAAPEPLRERIDPSLPTQGYRLRAGPSGIELVGADPAGLFYGRSTLEQLRRMHPDGLPNVEVADHPDRLVRGVMLDVSRDKVPRLDTLEALIDRLARLKVNHVQLYTEHAFAHAGHEEVWSEASPYTCEDVRRLDAFCRERHVELAPNRNCLGHMERWLAHDRYRPMAISTEGWTDPFGRRHPPYTMDPADPRVLRLMRELLGGMVPCFSSPTVHVGLDEPYGLGDDGIDDYLAHLEGLRSSEELEGKEMLVWGEVLYGRRILDRVPDGVTICVWGYEASFPFGELAGRVWDAGKHFWVCPGTSTWLGLSGRLANARANIGSAASVVGADGMLVCDWGDYGHLQYLPVSEAALAYGAAAAWCLETNEDADLAPALDVHVFEDDAGELGAAVCALGDAYTLADAYTPNITIFTLPLYYPDIRLGVSYEGAFSTEDLDENDLARVEDRCGEVQAALARARPSRPDAALVRDELETTAALVALLCRDGRSRLAGDGTLASIPDDTRGELAVELREIIGRHEELWLARNRPGGLRDSRWRLENLLAAYERGRPLGSQPPWVPMPGE